MEDFCLFCFAHFSLVDWYSLTRRQRLISNSWSGYLPRMWKKHDQVIPLNLSKDEEPPHEREQEQYTPTTPVTTQLERPGTSRPNSYLGL